MEQITELRKSFEAYLEQYKFQQEPKELYEPINYIMNLGGKRLRPILVLMAYRIFDAQYSNALPVAYAVEIFHNFSLVHDDIMDEAPLRRGKPSVHIAYGTNTGILAGDVMQIYAYEHLLKIGDPIKVKQLFTVFSQTAIAVCEGQQMDMNFEQRADVQIPEYLKMIECKTAALMAGSLEMGAIVAGASAVDTENLAQFGRNIGIAFQLQDDILDTFGDPEKFGKKVGGDIAQNKKTYLLLKALEVADAQTKRRLEHLMNGAQIEEKEKIAQVTSIFRQLNIPEQAEEIKAEYRDKAYQHLEAIQLSDAIKQPLVALAERFIQREI